MPVNTLMVEGSLDVALMTSVLSTLPGGAPVVEPGGSKGSLRPKVAEARKKGIIACYLRDRDFDTDPPTVCHAPIVDKKDQTGTVLGWRWCRHEVESYLLEPALVEHATGWAEADFRAALLGASSSLVHYTAARWAVGTARRALPPLYELGTRPDGLKNEIKLPADISDNASRGWAIKHIGDFLAEVQRKLAQPQIVADYEAWSQRLTAVSNCTDALLFHGGKDLTAALEPHIVKRRPNNPADFLKAIRDWVIANPGMALTLLPEWAALLPQLA